MQGIYKHYKGGLYVVKSIIENAVDGEDMVLYHAAENPNKLYVRYLSEFVAKFQKVEE